MSTEFAGLFAEDFRARVRDRILQVAGTDRRVTSGAIVGSLAHGKGDRWSDLDLIFAVQEEAHKLAVLDDLAAKLQEEFGATQLFDLPSGPTLFRVFLLPGCLQVDLSVSPASHFGAAGPNFELLFGETVSLPAVQPPGSRYLLGYAIHHLVRARFCIERGRLWQAEYWISAARDATLTIACIKHDLPYSFGRGFDGLPTAVRAQAEQSLIAMLTRSDLSRALAAGVELLINNLPPDTIDNAVIRVQIETLLQT